MIKDLKIFDAIVIGEDESIVNIAKTLKNNHNRHIFVVDADKKPIGILSPVDICAKIVAEGKDYANFVAKDIMNSPVETVDIEAETEFAMKIMIERNVYSCPVTENGKIRGEVSYNAVRESIIKKVNQ